MVAPVWGSKNDIACSGAEAISMMRSAIALKNPYQVAVIDLVMPDHDGIALAKQLGADEIFVETKLILLTAFDAAGFDKIAQNEGFRGCLTKPIKRSALLDCVIQAMNESEVVFDAASARSDLADLQPQLRQSRCEIILVAEDHPINQQVALLYLDQLGFSCHVVNNGQEAILAAQSNQYALLLMDCQMPEMDGFEATAKIRAHETLSGVHLLIVAITANAIKGDREVCLTSGMDDDLSKPFEIYQLDAILKKWLPKPSEHMAAAQELVEKIVDELQIFDVQALKQRVSDSGARQLLSIFATQMPRDLKKLQLATKLRDSGSLSRTTHSLRSVFGIIGVPGMNERCLLLETASGKNDWDLTEKELLDFENRLAPVMIEIHRELAQIAE